MDLIITATVGWLSTGGALVAAGLALIVAAAIFRAHQVKVDFYAEMERRIAQRNAES